MIQQFSKLSLNTQDLLFSQISDSQLPSSLIKTADIRKIDSIFLTNFKSFGKKYVGPFLNFTSIIGPNGSGKSNILDAVMFCFCSENSRHSLLDARQLINRQGKQTFKELMKQNKICSVSICFILTDDSKFTIQRILDPEGKQQFRINHEVVHKKVYENMLLRKGINCNTPNYAIWQGQIDRLVLKTPLQLTALFQNLSGSIYYKKIYDEIKFKLTTLQEQYEEKMKLINKIKIDKKNVKNLKKNNQHLQKLESTYSEIMHKFYLLKVLEKEIGIQQLEKQVEKTRKEEDIKMREINERKAMYRKSHQEKQSLQKQLGDIKEDLIKLQDLLQKIDNPTNVLYLQDLNLEINEAESIEKQIKNLFFRKQQLLKTIPEIPSSALIEEYLSIYEKWQQENSALNRQFIRRNNQLLFVEGMLQNKKQSLTDYQNRQQNFSKKREQNKELLKNYEQNLRQINNSIELIEKQKEKAHSNSKKHEKQLFAKEEDLQKLVKNIEDLENLIEEESSSKKQAELLKHLSSINHFYGVLEDKIQPTSHKYQVAFETLFSNISQQLIVQNERSSREVGNRLRQMNIMKTVLILDNVITNTGSIDRNKQQQSNQIRKRIGRDGQLAIDCIEHDEKLVGLKEYISHFLFGKIVCENIQAAYKIRNKKIEGIKQIYTLDGNVVKSDGSISTHGNPQALKKAHRYHSNKSNIFQDLSKLNKQKQKLQASIKETKNKTGITDRFASQITQLQIKKSQITEKIRQLEKTQMAKQQKPPQSLLIQIKELEKKQQKISHELSELDRMMRSSKMFETFMRKNNIEDLSVFRNANNFEQIQKMMKKKHEINRQIAEILSQMNELENRRRKKQKKIEKIKINIDALPEKKDRKHIEEEMAEKQEREIEIKNRISKLAVLTTKQSLHFQSLLPTLEARLQYTKQKIIKELEESAQELGVKFQYPIEIDEVRKQLDLPRKRKLGSEDFEQIYGELSAEKQKVETSMNKYNTLALMKHKPEDEQDFQSRIERLTEELDEIRESRSRQSEQLQKIRKDRAMVLLNFIEKLKYNLESSYRILTEMQNGLIGNIDLHIENTEFPFEYGTYYSPTPPTKRFVYDLEQLSGGQKSVASLALQYSLALATGVPFLVLDETDAYLDANNVQRFLKLIHHSLSNKNIQMIVISHKQSLFSQSQSLIGVSRPKSNPLSQVFSLKLISS